MPPAFGLHLGNNAESCLSLIDFIQTESTFNKNMKGFLPFVFAATLLSLSEQSSDSSNHGTEAQRVRPPPSDYHYIRGYGYYKFESNPRDFLNAVRYCEIGGAHLAILNSRGEAQALLDLIRPNVTPENNTVTIGFGDFFAKGEFLTVLGQRLQSTGYLNWKTGEPSVNFERNCGWMNENAQLGTQCCDCERMFLCEFETTQSC